MATRYPKSSPVGQYQPLHIYQPGTLVPVGMSASTTASTTTITAGNGVVVTPDSMANIVPGMMLSIANGLGQSENVQVISTTATTFTANFQYSHSGAYTIISLRGAHLGTIIVGNAGSGAQLILYNGHPANIPAGTMFAQIPLSPNVAQYHYNSTIDHGLFYSVGATGTMCDLTLMYIDHIV